MDEAQTLTSIHPSGSDFRSFADEVKSLIEAIADEYGLSVKISPYTSKVSNTCNAEVTFAIKTDRRGNTVDPELIAFERGNWSHKIDSKFFRAVFLDSSTYTYMRIVGFIPRSRKYTIAVETERGKKYKMAAKHVRECLDKGAWTNFHRTTEIK